MLRKGERLELTYRGERIAELVPVGSDAGKPSRLEALKHLHATTAADPGYADRAEGYLSGLRDDQKAWRDRTK